MNICQDICHRLKKLTCLVLSFSLSFNPLLLNIANAAPKNDIAIDSSAHSNYQAHLKSSANGVDVVDITAPTTSGVSINHWERLNNTPTI